MSLEFSMAGDAFFIEIILDGMEWEEHIIWVVVSNIFIFIPIWGRFPVWLIFFKRVETTNKLWKRCSSLKDMEIEGHLMKFYVFANRI